MTGDGASGVMAVLAQQGGDMGSRTTIENAYYAHDHDLFLRELHKLLEDKARLDYLEIQRLKTQAKGGGPFGWDAFHYRTGKDAGTVREQLDAERA